MTRLATNHVHCTIRGSRENPGCNAHAFLHGFHRSHRKIFFQNDSGESQVMHTRYRRNNRVGIIVINPLVTEAAHFDHF